MNDAELQRIRRKVEAGEKLTDRELESLRAAAQAQPGPTLRVAVAHALVNAGDDRTALQLLERLVRDFPRDLQAWLGLARAQLSLDRRAEAERSLKEALSLSPGDPEAMKVLAVLALQRGEIARARQALEDVLRRDPFDDEAKLLRAELEAADLTAPVTPEAQRAAEELAAQNPPNGAAAQSVALRPEFVRTVLRVLRARGVGAAAKGDVLWVQPQGTEAARVHLGSLYSAYLAGNRPLEEAVHGLVDGVIAAALGVPTDASALLKTSLPVLRPASFVDVAPGAAHREGPAGVMVFYAVDDPELVRYVPTGSLEARGVSVDVLDHAAFENLAKKDAVLQRVRIEKGALQAADHSSGVLAIASQDGHDGARLLLPQIRERIARDLGPAPWRVDLGRREVALLCRELDADSCAALDAFTAEPDGIEGKFRLKADGVLERIAGNSSKRPEK